jgi:N-acetylmuramoyl-L-alanine amidase
MRHVDTIIVHYSATPEGREVPVEEIRRWHVEERGWADIGYHYVVHLDGSVSTGRPEGVIGAHAAGHNRTSIGICYVGGLRDGQSADTRTPEQTRALREIIADIRSRHGEGVRLAGHRDVGATECPGFDVATSDLVRDMYEERPSLPALDPNELPSPAVPYTEPLPLPAAALAPVEALSARRVVAALDDAGFSRSEIRRIAEALAPLWEIGAQEVPYWRTARWALLGLRDTWTGLRSALRSFKP